MRQLLRQWLQVIPLIRWHWWPIGEGLHELASGGVG